MRLTIPAVLALMAATACQPTNDPQMNSTLGGAAVGGVIGAAVSSDDDRLQGALTGATVGAAAGLLLGPQDDGNCRYRRSDGSEYIARCP